MAIERDLVIDQGETLEIDLRWISKETKLPVDITGCEFVLQARKDKSSSSPVLLDMTTTNGRIPIVDAADGQFKVLITDEYSFTLSLTPEPTNKREYYELVCRHPDGRVTKLWKGNTVFYKATVYPA